MNDTSYLKSEKGCVQAMSWLIDRVLLSCVTLLRAGSLQWSSIPEFQPSASLLLFKKGSKFKLSFDARLKKDVGTFFSGFEAPQTNKGCHEKGIDSHV